MQQIWQSAENAIFAENGKDPTSGKRWDDLIDMDSWARKYLMQEIFGNADVLLASEYFYYNAADQLLYAGPIWDMDATLQYKGQPWLSCRGIIAGRPHLTKDTDRNLFYELLQKPAFSDKVKELYQREFRPYLCKLLDGGLESYSCRTRQAILSHVVRWQEDDSQEDVMGIEAFLRKRMELLDDRWIYETELFLVQVQQYNRVWAFAAYPGETLEFLPDMEEIWYRTDTGEILDKTMPVNTDMFLEVRPLDG